MDMGRRTRPRSDWADADLARNVIAEAAIALGVATWNGEPMCRKGHVITGVNVALDKGRPRCRECKRERQRTWKRAKSAATSSPGAGSGSTAVRGAEHA